jgi:hypothetical protein
MQGLRKLEISQANSRYRLLITFLCGAVEQGRKEYAFQALIKFCTGSIFGVQKAVDASFWYQCSTIHIAIAINAVLPIVSAGLSRSLVDASDDAMISLKRL